MAIYKVPAPGATPATFWPETINQLAALVMDKEKFERISGGFVKAGSVFNIGGILYIANIDTAISGTRDTAIAIKITPNGDTATAEYTASISGVAWNGTYKGNYDVNGNLYIYTAMPGDYVRDGLMTSRSTTVSAGNYVLVAEFKVGLIGIFRLKTTGTGFMTVKRNGVDIITGMMLPCVDNDLACMESDVFGIYILGNGIGITSTMSHVSVRTTGFGFTVA